jgi:hypothetical protein
MATDVLEISLPPHGALALRVRREDLPLVLGWIPRLPPDTGGEPEAIIAVGRGERAGRRRLLRWGSKPAFELESLRVWVDGDAAIGAGEAAFGGIDLARLRASVGVTASSAQALTEVFWLLTASAALLLGRLGCALLHAGAVVDGQGRAWLLVGSGGSGKTTACANLMRTGWRCLADDHVVLSREAGGEIWAHGLARAFGLDAGWPEDESLGEKRRVDPLTIAADGLVPSAPVAGVLLPSISKEPTTFEPAGEAETLGQLLRQSPWLTIDRAKAKPLMDLLGAAARGKNGHLRLGPEAFRDPAPIAAALAAFTTA